MFARHQAENKKRQGPSVFEIEESFCVWMEARIVNFKLCNHAYDCLSCPFDLAMRAAWSQGRDGRKEGT